MSWVGRILVEKLGMFRNMLNLVDKCILNRMVKVKVFVGLMLF